MGKPRTLLEDLCRHTLSCEAQSLEVECREGSEWVYLNKGETRLKAANFAGSSREAKELRENLAAARKKPVRTSIYGHVWILTVAVKDKEDVLRVSIDRAAGLDPLAAPPFTKTQGQYLAFIYNYSKIHGRAPAESDLQRYFQKTPPAVHDMIKTLELRGFIERTPGQARSIRLLVRPEYLPTLG